MLTGRVCPEINGEPREDMIRGTAEGIGLWPMLIVGLCLRRRRLECFTTKAQRADRALNAAVGTTAARML